MDQPVASQSCSWYTETFIFSLDNILRLVIVLRYACAPAVTRSSSCYLILYYLFVSSLLFCLFYCFFEDVAFPDAAVPFSYSNGEYGIIYVFLPRIVFFNLA